MAQERKRRRFTAEYKAEAVKRLAESGKPLQEVSEELGVHPDQLRGWRDEHLAAGSAEAVARQKAEAAELARLRRSTRARPSLSTAPRATARRRWRGASRPCSVGRSCFRLRSTSAPARS